MAAAIWPDGLCAYHSPMPRPKKVLSQNFLSDPRILGRIADAVGAGQRDAVLEIGPEPGGLTKELVKRAGRVVAIDHASPPFARPCLRR